jgi:TRAP-type mannitol/chloroaromatic compound transport system permease small subunit
LRKILDGICTTSERSGRIFSWLSLALIFAITYDVAARYLFSAPTVWSYDISYMLGGSLMVLGGAYTLLHRGHVSVDIVYSRLSPRAQAILDTVLTFFIFFPLISVLLYFATTHAIKSVITQEVSAMGTSFTPVMWPFRCVLVIAIFLFLLQGIAWFAQNIIKLMKGGRHA